MRSTCQEFQSRRFAEHLHCQTAFRNINFNLYHDTTDTTQFQRRFQIWYNLCVFYLQRAQNTRIIPQPDPKESANTPESSEEDCRSMYFTAVYYVFHCGRRRGFLQHHIETAFSRGALFTTHISSFFEVCCRKRISQFTCPWGSWHTLVKVGRFLRNLAPWHFMR